jgi:hypothetical protein
MTVELSRLTSDFYLEFVVIAYNGTAGPLKLERIRGQASFAVALPAGELIKLPAPAVREDTPPEFGPFNEFLVVVSQHVPGVLATMIADELSAGLVVKFDFEDLHVEVRGEEWAEPTRLPLWAGVTCRREGKTLVVGRIFNEWLGDVTRAGG